MMKFDTFGQVIGFLESYGSLKDIPSQETVRKYRLERIKTLLNVLGNPQNTYRTIHVAGSKGKGSTASYIAKGIEAAGFRCGLYLSPHVCDYRERFTLAGKFFDDEVYIKTAEIMAEMLEKTTVTPSVFEMYTAYAFLLFSVAGCDWAVIETGLGGRLDATNIITPQASVLTPIELEHTEILGDTLEKIAVEKSKIIKPGVPVFISHQENEAMSVLEKEAETQHSQVIRLNDCLSELETKQYEDYQNVSFRLSGKSFILKLRMTGMVQALNCALALLVLNRFDLICKDTLETLENNTLPGRMENLCFRNRSVCLDGAHTLRSMTNLIETFSEIHPKHKGICIFGSVLGKNYRKMIQIVLGQFSKVVIVKPGTFKKSNPQVLYEFAMSVKSPEQTVVLCNNATEALTWSIEHSTENTPILVCGSFYLAGYIREAMIQA
ncbi:MAG: bifunctional folylpolyglutamate synthase/dihydrofolate synthase [Sphaerochaetaceae bacterium]|nr:bifunctional folylpolyglutamate synthase/dihydrofolate synthase [Sphaerochaetaceae bacterium]